MPDSETVDWAVCRMQAESPAVMQVARLVKCGIPYAEAMGMSATRRLAWIVAFGTIEGREFNWGVREWKQP